MSSSTSKYHSHNHVLDYSMIHSTATHHHHQHQQQQNPLSYSGVYDIANVPNDTSTQDVLSPSATTLSPSNITINNNNNSNNGHNYLRSQRHQQQQQQQQQHQHQPVPADMRSESSSMGTNGNVTGEETDAECAIINTPYLSSSNHTSFDHLPLNNSSSSLASNNSLVNFTDTSAYDEQPEDDEVSDDGGGGSRASQTENGGDLDTDNTHLATNNDMLSPSVHSSSSSSSSSSLPSSSSSSFSPTAIPSSNYDSSSLFPVSSDSSSVHSSKRSHSSSSSSNSTRTRSTSSSSSTPLRRPTPLTSPSYMSFASSSLSASSTQPLLSAQEAFRQGNAAASKRFHDMKKITIMDEDYTYSEAHQLPNKHSGHLRAIVYGGLDGVVTVMTTVSAVVGAGLSLSIVLIIGLAHLLANGVSMGAGDAMSIQAENEVNNLERRREKWEMDNNLEGEIDEMVALYMKKGVSRGDAMTIIHTLAKYEDVFLDHMMVEELGIMPSDFAENPLVTGMLTLLSFMVFGAVPVLPYVLPLFVSASLIPVELTTLMQLWCSLVLATCALFVLGSIKGAYIDVAAASSTLSSWWMSGIMTVANGSLAAIVGYLTALGVNQYLDTYHPNLFSALPA